MPLSSLCMERSYLLQCRWILGSWEGCAGHLATGAGVTLLHPPSWSGAWLEELPLGGALRCVANEVFEELLVGVAPDFVEVEDDVASVASTGAVGGGCA